MNHVDTDKARAKQRQRQDLQAPQGIDALAKRATLIERWKLAAKCNPAYAPHNGAWWWVFTWNTSFRHLVMPALRARLEAADQADRKVWLSELRASSKNRQAATAGNNLELFA